MKQYLIMLCMIFFSINTTAQGNLLIAPARVVFEGQSRMQELNLANTGKDTARYLISFIEIKMNEDGTFKQISQPDSGQQFASGNLRYFPRSVILAPNEAQTIKIQLVKTSQLAPGEYRSHIYFRAESMEKPLADRSALKDSFGLSVKLIPVFGISIPVIIRVGDTRAAANISGLTLTPENRLSMTFNRTGNASIYGGITVIHISEKGKVSEVGVVNGLAVYTPNLFRQFNINLDDKQGVDYHKGMLRVVYTTKKGTVSTQLAKAELQLK
ncbi:hypothetical protein QFZ48_002621 [Chitinophaga sp. W2I13]|uniref:hypothetical protein n=1 Tax=Chitinophaga sp. W2I13 TaxID=3373923 RepID=UPI003D21917E